MPAFFTCMSGIPYFSSEKVDFFRGITLSQYPHTGGEYNVYKASNVMAYNLAVYANAMLPRGEPSHVRLRGLKEIYNKVRLNQELS